MSHMLGFGTQSGMNTAVDRRHTHLSGCVLFIFPQSSVENMQSDAAARCRRCHAQRKVD